MTILMEAPATETLETEGITESPPPQVEQAMESAVQSVAETILSDEDRAFLERRPAILASLRNVSAAKDDLAEAMKVEEQAKTSRKGKEAALEAAWEALYQAELAEDETAMPLFKAGESSSASSEVAQGPQDQSLEAWEGKWKEFLARPVTDLDLTETIKEKISDHGPDPIRTLGDLTKVKERNPTQGYCEIKGIGETKADAIDDAFEKLVGEFMVANPKPSAGVAAPAAPAPTTKDAGVDPGPADYDFISAFPAAINPTPNESYTEDYHRTIVKEQTAELVEIRQAKSDLESGTQAGKPLTDKSRKKLEQRLAETQMQFDEGFGLYEEKFGSKASERLQNFVTGEVDRQGALKGGLE